jgi:hypothetical protein
MSDEKKVEDGWRVLNIGGVSPNTRSYNLKELCPAWTGRVSEEARAEIRANEERAAKVLTTSHLFLFK